MVSSRKTFRLGTQLPKEAEGYQREKKVLLQKFEEGKEGRERERGRQSSKSLGNSFVVHLKKAFYRKPKEFFEVATFSASLPKNRKKIKISD